MSKLIQIQEKVIVGGPESGHDLLVSMVGSYLSKVYNIQGFNTTTVAARAVELCGWNSLIASTASLGYTGEHAKQKVAFLEENYKGASDKVMLMERDYKDQIAIAMVRTGTPRDLESALKASNRLDEITRKVLSLGGSHSKISFEDMVENPHSVLVSVLKSLVPTEDTRINLETVEEVVTESEIRGLRFDSGSGLLERIGTYGDILPREVAVDIDATQNNRVFM